MIPPARDSELRQLGELRGAIRRVGIGIFLDGAGPAEAVDRVEIARGVASDVAEDVEFRADHRHPQRQRLEQR
jgi:hypothetical protein